MTVVFSGTVGLANRKYRVYLTSEGGSFVKMLTKRGWRTVSEAEAIAQAISELDVSDEERSRLAELFADALDERKDREFDRAWFVSYCLGDTYTP